MKMKSILPILTLMIGFGIGWYFSGQRIQENVKAVMPAEMHETLDAVAEYLGPMSKEEVNETMEMIRVSSQRIVNEMDHETLWRAMIAERLTNTLREQGMDAFIESSNYEMNRFYEQYEEGLEIGDWQQAADALYTRTKTEEIQAE